MKFWTIVVILMALFWSYTDVRADNIFQTVLAPLCFGVLSLAVFIKVMQKLGLLANKSSGSYSDGYYGSGDNGSSGSDGGGCD